MKNKREAVVAGQFYPNNPDELRLVVRSYLDSAQIAPPNGKTVAAIAPHAGYIYSGPTAGFAYARMRTLRPNRVILLGSSHRERFATASVYTTGAFTCPLGELTIDTKFAETAAQNMQSRSESAHLFEHSLEVHLPFIMEAFGSVPIVPILFGSAPGPQHTQYGAWLAEAGDDNDVLIASTDLSHYLSESEANRIDKNTVDTILNHDIQSFMRMINEGSCSACGAAAVTVAMAYALARGADNWSLLDYRTSAAASGDYSRVVGYAAISMEQSA